MKYVFAGVVVLAVLAAGIFSLSSLNTRNRLFEGRYSSLPIRELRGDEISRLPYGVIVRFPASIKQRFSDDCIEVFAPNDLTFNGDPKYAVPSRFAQDLGSLKHFLVVPMELLPAR